MLSKFGEILLFRNRRGRDCGIVTCVPQGTCAAQN